LLDDSTLFLDFDGTLVEIADTPGGVVVDARVRDILAGLSIRLGGRLALVSGRPAADIARLAGAEGIAIAGSHGLEIRWPTGETATPQRSASLDIALDKVRRFAAPHPGLLVEDKPFGVALHYRAAPASHAACQSLALSLAEETGLLLQPGKMVFELKMSGGDKGAAVRAFMASPLMSRGAPVFVGDDATDESAFNAVADLGGAGVLVGEQRETAALYRLPDVAHVLDWLQQACEPVS
jgi:trehalose 6-phosphate phosphatase